MSTVTVTRPNMTETELYEKAMVGRHVDRPAGTVVAAWAFPDGVKLRVRLDDVVEKAGTVGGLGRILRGQWS